MIEIICGQLALNIVEIIDCVFIWELFLNIKWISEMKQSSPTGCCGMHNVLFDDIVLNI